MTDDPLCPLCLEEENERPAAQEYDGVMLCTFHTMGAQTDAEGVRDRVAAHKAPSGPMLLLTIVQVPGAIEWITPDVTPPRGKVVMRGPSSADRQLYADGVLLGRVTDVDVDRDHFYAEGALAPTQTIINRTAVEIMLDVAALAQRDS